MEDEFEQLQDAANAALHAQDLAAVGDGARAVPAADDRVQLLDELPAGVAQRLMQGLSASERDITLPLLGYPKGSIGRLMSPEYVSVRARLTLGDALTHVRHRGLDAETVYTLPVTDDERRVEGVVSLRDLVMGAADTSVEIITIDDASRILEDADDEDAARQGAAEPLARPYLTMSVLGIVRSPSARSEPAMCWPWPGAKCAWV